MKAHMKTHETNNNNNNDINSPIRTQWWIELSKNIRRVEKMYLVRLYHYFSVGHTHKIIAGKYTKNRVFLSVVYQFNGALPES